MEACRISRDVFVWFMDFPFLNIYIVLFKFVQPFAPSCFKEFHSSTSPFLAPPLLVLNWTLTNWICCGVITTQEQHLLPLHLLSLCSHHSGFYRCPSSSLIPLPGWIPTCSFAPRFNAINPWWIIPSVMNLSWSFYRITVTWPEPHTIFKKWGHYPQRQKNAFHFLLYFPRISQISFAFLTDTSAELTLP